MSNPFKYDPPADEWEKGAQEAILECLDYGILALNSDGTVYVTDFGKALGGSREWMAYVDAKKAN